MSGPAQSWNRLPRAHASRVVDLTCRFDAPPALQAGETALVHGLGRSYGDVCLNDGGVILRSRALDHFISFDRSSGRLEAEAGVSLAEILDFAAPRGWFLPVTPGTRFVTLGGAVANDVHGKNHHVAGAFGHHVTELELLRADGERIVCSPSENADWFAATIGGLGLTGLIARVALQLMPVQNPFLVAEARRFRSLDAFWDMNAEAERDFPYTAAWIDCLARAGRGVLLSARHAPAQGALPPIRAGRLAMPFDPPVSLINPLSLRLFNAAYYRRPLPRGPKLTHYAPYLHPLDGVANWNRIYGRRGFYQYQCVLPPEAARAGVSDMLARIARAGAGSFLAVLKTFGPKPSLGLLSFPRPGATLALDFPDGGAATLRLFDELDAVVRAAGGALYPAKDARMSGDMFRRGFPRWEDFTKFIDPKFSSGFWRRVTER